MTDTADALDTTGETPDLPEQAGAPVKSTNRIASLDFIRGIAVLGILAANIVAFGQPFGAYIWPDAFVNEGGAGSDWLWFAQFVIIDGKMRGLFTLLFGAGLYLFMERAWARGQTRWLQLRRLLWLLLFGAIHFYFIWRGDILILYSVAGLVGLLCLRWTAKAQLITGLVGYVLGALLFSATMGPSHFVMNTEFGASAEMSDFREGLDVAKQEAIEDDAAEAQILTEGTYSDFVRHNFNQHGTDPLLNLFTFVLETLPLMLVGMALYRFGLFSGGLNAHKQRIWGWVGVITGSVLTAGLAWWVLSTGLTYYSTLSAFIGFGGLPRLPVVIGLAALLALWGAHASGWLAERLAAAGRMAFSNYLGTSIVMVLIFHPWAGGLWGTLDRAELYLVVALGWALMLGWSRPWLERFRYGPLEWLWRCLTYGRLFPIKR